MPDEVSRSECSRQSSVLDALKSGFVSPELREHIAGCEECAEAAAVATFLQQLGNESADTRVLAADHLWWKLQVRARTEAFEKVRRSVAVLQWAMSVAVILAAGCAAAWQWDAVCNWSGSLGTADFLKAVPAREFARDLWLSWKLALLAGAGLIALFAGVAMWLAHPKD
jgi:hypothetical protein